MVDITILVYLIVLFQPLTKPGMSHFRLGGFNERPPFSLALSTRDVYFFHRHIRGCFTL